nr:hypothetical protein Q903MT_gene6327 [Picea sitchensis]
MLGEMETICFTLGFHNQWVLLITRPDPHIIYVIKVSCFDLSKMVRVSSCRLSQSLLTNRLYLCL